MNNSNRSNKKNNLHNTLSIFVRFCIVGITNTVIGYLIYLLVIFILKEYHTKSDVFIANTVSFILSVLWSFFWNNRFVFKKEEGERRNLFKTLMKTYVSYGFSGIILTNALSYLWVGVFYVSKNFAPLLCLPVTVPVNFLLNKIWAFRTKKE